MNDLAIQELSNSDVIRSRIFTIRGVQVMLDRDLAELYGVATKVLNQAVKRNIERFPSEFTFLITSDEMIELVTNCDRFKNMKHSSVPMRAFTEHGIIMLASVLKSDIATQVSVRITKAFVAMRRFLLANAQMFQRIETVEKRQIATDAKVDSILERLDATETPLQGVFYDGQLWDARALVLKLIKFIRRAKNELIVIDAYPGVATGECCQCENVASSQFQFPIEEAA